jgi:protein-tyrosine phosphatase
MMPMVDIHTHILPNVDDGARSWEMAIHMCHMAGHDGVAHMVATPHANDEYLYDRPHLQGVLAELAQRVGPILTFSLGCDFHFSYENLLLLDQDPQTFTIGSTQYMLVEFSDYSIPPWISTKLQDLLAMGLRPIITHPERNLLLQQKPEQVLQWADLGCPVQVTASSLTGRWGDKALKVSQWLLRKQAVHVIASDCHNVEGRSPILSGARTVLEKSYGTELAQALTHDNPLAIVENRPLPYFPPINS